MGRALVNKAQKGMTMKQLKMKYPSADTTAKGDVRGSEMNSSAPKKVLKKYNDTYDAFDKKFKGGPAKDKKGGVVKSKMKMGGKMAKQAAVAIAMKKAGKAPKKMMQYGGAAASMKPTMKMGGKMSKMSKKK